MQTSLAAQPDDLREAHARIQRWRAAGPALFAVEALGVPEEWSPLSKKGVLPWQWEASRLLVEKRRLSVRSGKGVGKSAFLSWTILWFHCCFFPCKAGCTAPTATQMSDVLWAELAMWHRHLRERVPPLGESFEWKTDQFELREAPKESFAVARTARKEKPEALQGLHSQHTLVIVDEASGVEDIIFEAARGALSGENAWVLFASNPTRTSGMFYETHHKLRDMWGHLQVNAEDVPLVSKQSIEEIAYQYGRDSNYYRVAVQGEFPRTEDDVVIPLELCEGAKNREVEAYGSPVWGVDVARFGSDRTVLVERVANATTGKHSSWNGTDTMQTAGRIFAKWNETLPESRPQNIFVDAIGIGAGVVDRLQELGLPAVGINVAESPSVDELYMRSRDELWFRARKWLEKRNCRLFPDETLIAELSLPKYKYTSTGKLQVESKEDMKKRYPRSPDVADAFCLTFADAAEYRGPGGYEPPHFEDF